MNELINENILGNEKSFLIENTKYILNGYTINGSITGSKIVFLYLTVKTDNKLFPEYKFYSELNGLQKEFNILLKQIFDRLPKKVIKDVKKLILENNLEKEIK